MIQHGAGIAKRGLGYHANDDPRERINVEAAYRTGTNPQRASAGVPGGKGWCGG